MRRDAPRKILVVDDSADTAETLAMLLETAGHAAEFVTDPRAVLPTAARQRPDAVFLDIGMPYLDGFELAAMLKRAFPGICIVAITGRESDEDRKRGRQAGFDAYVLKPVDFALVESILATMFASREARWIGNAEAKVAVVTGAARGIGLATTRRFVAAGYVTDIAQVRAAAAKVEAGLGRVVALVNNAGVAVFKPILETTLDEWRRVLAVNLDGPFICTQVFAPAMLRGGGAVVNIASISGVRASALRVAYGTSKAALMHLTKQQALELGAMGIRVNAVAPGPVDTAMAKQVHTASIRADYHDAIPLNRYGEEREIAEAVLFLCSDAASYVNGQTLAVDGGFDASGIGLKDLRRQP